jgi:3-methylfumaryl-CoA hydratase
VSEPAPRLEDLGFEPLTRSDIVAEPARRLAACLDADPGVLDDGTLPMLWHWAYFLPSEPTAALGSDGHGERRPEMDAFPRRMFGSGRVRVVEPLRLGEPAERASELRSAARKEGSTGTFWVATVAQSVTQGGRLRVEEERDYLLRAPAAVPRPGPARRDRPDASWVEEITPDPALLFRFSAVTFNTHRIHYDRPYAIEVEGYPDLVVQGPLTAILLAEMARRRGARDLHSIAFRAQAPLFVGRRIWLTGSPTASGVTMAAVRDDHAIAMTFDGELPA